MENKVISTATEWLDSRIFFGVKAGLENIQEILFRLNQPHLQFKSVHVAGSNGKGSTASLLQALLGAHFVQVGLFTSPHLVNVRERIRVGNEFISEEDFEDYLGQVRDAASDDIAITFFEVMTAVACLHFAAQKVDYAILEVGLGGRLDATNAIDTELAILTGIALEHTQWLGSTLSEILGEKFGVSRSHKPLVAWVAPELKSVLTEKCVKKSVPLHFLEEDSAEFKKIPSRYRAGFRRNAALALKALWSLVPRVDEQSVDFVLENHVWTGRFQKLKFTQGPLVILDGAHNPEGVEHLTELLAQEPQKKWTFVVGIVEDKDAQNMLKAVQKRADRLILTQGSHPRFASCLELAKFVDGAEVMPQLSQVIDWIRNQNEADGGVVVCGSLYLLGDVIGYLSPDFEELKGFRSFLKTPNEGAFKAKISDL